MTLYKNRHIMTKRPLNIRSASNIFATFLFAICLIFFIFSGTGMADIAEGTFESVADSEALRTNGSGQDWYESRGDDPSLLELDTNSSNKAKFIGSSDNDTYLTQEFSTPLTGISDVEWNIYIEEIIDIKDKDARDRAGFMLIGDYDDNGFLGTPGPNSDDWERFMCMAFYRNHGGETGDVMELVAQDDRDNRWDREFTTVYSDLHLGQWYTIKVRCYLEEDEYNVYVDGDFMRAIKARNYKDSLTYLSFAQLSNGAGTFYVDNVSQINLYILDIDTVGQGSVSIGPLGDTHDYDNSLILYNSGTLVTLTPKADSGWVFREWSGALSGDDNPATITMDNNKSITASFGRTYNLAVTTVPDGSGSVTLDPADDGPYVSGKVVTLTPEATPGWEFKGWSGDLSGDDNPTTITMDGNKSVTAFFQIMTYDLNVTTSENGTVLIDPANGPYEHGTIVTLTVEPETGWHFTGWSDDLSGTALETTILMDNEKNVTANFAINITKYAITFSSGDHGGLSGNTNQTEVEHGGSCTPVTAHPAEGYQFSNWSGDYTGNENPLTLMNVISDMTITANYVLAHDGNNDGTPDVNQDHVKNLTTNNQQSVTLEFSESAEVTSYGPVDDPSPDGRPAGYDFEYGFFNFTIEGVESGGATTVTIYLPDGSTPDTYYKYGPTPTNTTYHWYDFSFDGTTGAEINGNIITLHFVDGDRGDDDLSANGKIVDDGGPGLSNVDVVNEAGSDESQGATGGCFVSTVKPPLFVD